MVGIRNDMKHDIGDTDYIVDDDTFDQTNLSPISTRTSERKNTGVGGGGRGGGKFPIFNDNSSLLGVIVDRSSFDDDDELTTCITTYGGRDAPSIIDENHPSSSSLSINLPDHHQQLHNQQQHLIDMNIPGGVGSISGMGGGAGGGGGVVMRNGKVRRKLRWKPRFGKKKSYNGDVSSNASVVSALTNRSNSTSRSSSTTRSFLSHFSKKSNTSFHTFHSTETPKATNKANRPQAPHTVMRPNYQDSFDHNNKNKNSKHSTIDTEGVNIQQQNHHQHQHHHQTIGSFRSNLDSVQESSPSAATAATNGVEQHDNENRDAEVVSRQNSSGIPRSPSNSVTDSKSISTSTSTSTINNNNYEVKNITDTSSISNASTTTHSAMQKPPMPSPSQKSQEQQQQQQQQQQSKPRRPPLFKRRMRHFKNSNNNNNSDNKTTQKACSSPTNTNETSSLLSISPSHSLENENSVIPMSLGEEYEEDRRVLFDATKPPTASTATTANRNRSSSKKPRDIVTVTTTRSKTEKEKRDEEVSSVVTGVSGGSASTQPEGVCLEEGIEESSASPSYHNSVDNQSIQSGSVNGDASSVVSHTSVLTVMQKRISLLTKKRSSSSASLSTASPQRGGNDSGSNMIHPPSPSGVSVPSSPFSSQQAADNPSLDSSSVTSKGLKKSSSSSSSGGRQEKTSASVPCNLDEGVFLEAERNLRAINEMAAEHMAHGEYEEAADVFEEILRGQQERYGHDHYRVGAALHNLGIVYLKKGDYTKAIEICQRAVAVRKESLVPNHPDVAVSLAQLGVAHLESQNFKKALSAFKDALHIRRNFLGARHHKCSKILNNIGCALYSIEDFVASKRAFDEALGIQRDALRSIPSTESTESTHMQSNALLLSMASTLCNIGSIKVRWGEFDEATVDIEEALLIQQSVLGDDHPTVLSTSDSIELIDSAQHGASNHRTNAHDFLMKKAVAVCSDTETNPATMMTELFGIENLETISPKNWFLNACGPVSPRKTEKVGE